METISNGWTAKMNDITNNEFHFLNQENAYKETSLWYKVIKRNSHSHFCVIVIMKNVKPVMNVKQNVLVTGKVQSRHVL